MIEITLDPTMVWASLALYLVVSLAAGYLALKKVKTPMPPGILIFIQLVWPAWVLLVLVGTVKGLSVLAWTVASGLFKICRAKLAQRKKP